MKGLSYRMLVIILGIAVAILVAFTTIVNSQPGGRNAFISTPATGKTAADLFKTLVPSSRSVSAR